MITNLWKVLTIWWHSPVNTGVLHSFHHNTPMQPEITGLLVFKAQQANPLSASWTLPSWDQLTQALLWRNQTILFGGSRQTMTPFPRHGIYSPVNQSCSAPSCCKGTAKGWLPSPLQFHIPQLQWNCAEMILSSRKNKVLKLPLLLTPKMCKNCISFHPFET